MTLPTVQVTAHPSDARDRVTFAMPHLGRRVLVVDDSVDAAETVATLLQAAGCVTRAVHSGEQAVTSTVDFGPEIVLLDVGLPGVDGLEVCRRIRTLPGGQAVYVVAITGWGQDDDRRKTRDAGFDAHLVKPVDIHALLRLVEHAPRVGQAPS